MDVNKPPDPARNAARLAKSREALAFDFFFTTERESREEPAKERVTLFLMRRTVERLEELTLRTEASSKAELLKNALQVYEVLVDEIQRGGELVIRDKDGREHSYKIFL